MCFTHNFWSLTVQGLSDGFVYALIALGYTLVYGVLQLINFAHSEVFMSGGFAGYFVLVNLIGSHPPSGAASVGLVVLGISAGAAAGGGVAFLLERVAYRPLRRRNAPRLAFLISAIGASFFLYNLAGKEFGRDSVSIPAPFNLSTTVFTVFGASVQTYQIVIAVSAVAMLLVLDRLVAVKPSTVGNTRCNAHFGRGRLRSACSRVRRRGGQPGTSDRGDHRRRRRRSDARRAA